MKEGSRNNEWLERKGKRWTGMNERERERGREGREGND